MHVTLQTAIAAPFKWAGTTTLTESEIVVALSLDRDWFSPDQAKRVIDVAAGQGLLERSAAGVTLTIDAESIGIPDDYSPTEDIFTEWTVFERILNAIVTPERDKRTTVAEINRIQRELAITVETAAVLHAHRLGIDVNDFVDPVRELVYGDEDFPFPSTEE